MQSSSAKRSRALFCLLLFLALISAGQGVRLAMRPLGSQDFCFWYGAAKYVALGLNPYVVPEHPAGPQDLFEFMKTFNHFLTNVPPSMLMIELPFTPFAPFTAKLLWLICNFLCTIGIIVLLRKLLPPLFTPPLEKNASRIAWVALAAILMIGTPWRNIIKTGQPSVVVYFFFLLSLYLSDRGSRILSGICLAVSFCKYTVTAPITLYLLYKRRYRELAVAALVHIALMVFASIWMNMSLADLILLPLKIISAQKYSTYTGAYELGRVLLGKSSWAFNIGLLLLAMTPLLLGKFWGTDEDLLSLLTMFALIVVYHRLYDYFVLMFPFINFFFKPYATRMGTLGKWLLCGVLAYAFVIHSVLRVVFDVNGGLFSLCETAYAYFYYAALIVLTIGVYTEARSNKTNEERGVE